jgi:hypothetical protein
MTAEIQILLIYICETALGCESGPNVGLIDENTED